MMKVNFELEENDYNHLHDVVMSATGESKSKEELLTLFNNLPENIKGLAVQWGASDTVFRDKVYDYLKKQDIISGD